MGWWRISSVASGGIDWSLPSKSGLVNAIPGRSISGALYNGDEPADILGPLVARNFVGLTKRLFRKPTKSELYKRVLGNRGGVSRVHAAYQKAWGRKATPKELEACFNFCASPHFDINPPMLPRPATKRAAKRPSAAAVDARHACPRKSRP